jgi:ankyrin repeat protein
MTLIEAADEGDLKEVVWLLDHGADVNGTEQFIYDTPLIFAAGRGHHEIVEYLVSRGADVNSGREHGRSAVMQAICNHHPQLAQWLIGRGADVTAKDREGDSVLHYAAHYGDREIAQLLISRGAAINAKGTGGRTPLYATLAFRASQLRDISVAETLLQHGADPNIGVTDDLAFGETVKTPLQLAADLKFPELEGLLRKHGAK